MELFFTFRTFDHFVNCELFIPNLIFKTRKGPLVPDNIFLSLSVPSQDIHSDILLNNQTNERL